MKFLLIFIFCCFACLGDANRTRRAPQTACLEAVHTVCYGSQPSQIKSCNAQYAGAKHNSDEINAFINLLLVTSYDYLLMATHFNTHQANRLGFYRLYMDLSERSFYDALQILVRNARRGGDTAGFVQKTMSISSAKRYAETNELESLASALDKEKTIYENALRMNHDVSHAPGERKDPEWSSLLENQIMNDHARLIRTIAGYITELQSMLQTQDPSVCLYIFDRFLKTQIDKSQQNADALGDIQAYSIEFWGITINFCISFAVSYCKEFHPFGLTVNLCIDFAVKYCT